MLDFVSQYYGSMCWLLEYIIGVMQAHTVDNEWKGTMVRVTISTFRVEIWFIVTIGISFCFCCNLLAIRESRAASCQMCNWVILRVCKPLAILQMCNPPAIAQSSCNLANVQSRNLGAGGGSSKCQPSSSFQTRNFLSNPALCLRL